MADIVAIEYEKGFYDLFNDKTIPGLYVFPKYCYDKLIVTTKSESIDIYINTRMFMFEKLVKYLRARILKSRQS